MKRLVDVLKAKPTVLGAVASSWLVVGIGFGLDISMDQMVGLVAAINLTAAFVVDLFVVPTKDADAAKDVAVNHRETEIHAYLAGAEKAKPVRRTTARKR